MLTLNSVTGNCLICILYGSLPLASCFSWFSFTFCSSYVWLILIECLTFILHLIKIIWGFGLCKSCPERIYLCFWQCNKIEMIWNSGFSEDLFLSSSYLFLYCSPLRAHSKFYGFFPEGLKLQACPFKFTSL